VAGSASLRGFALRLLLALGISLALWAGLLAPHWDRWVASSGVALLARLESPALTGAAEPRGLLTVIHHVGPAAELPDQRLELRTHHNNTPLLVALLLATPGFGPRRRLFLLAAGLGLLFLTHVAYFVLSVHWVYALANIGPYRVTDLRYLGEVSLREILASRPQTAKWLLGHAYLFATSVGRRIAPLLIWSLLCWRPLLRWRAAAAARA